MFRDPSDEPIGIRKMALAVRAEIERQDTDIRALHAALESLLIYLASRDGRTDQNCAAVDFFFCVRDDWARDWDHLPEAYQAILWDMGGQLHDTVSAPEVASDFESTPEQLLVRLRRLSPESPVT